MASRCKSFAVCVQIMEMIRVPIMTLLLWLSKRSLNLIELVRIEAGINWMAHFIQSNGDMHRNNLTYFMGYFSGWTEEIRRRLQNLIEGNVAFVSAAIVENSMNKLWTIAVDKQFMYKGFYSIANECKRQTQLHQHRRGKKYIIQTIEAVKCIRNTHTYAPPSLYPTHTHHLANGSASRSTLIRTISHSALSLSNRRPCRMSSDFSYFFPIECPLCYRYCLCGCSYFIHSEFSSYFFNTQTYASNDH